MEPCKAFRHFFHSDDGSSLWRKLGKCRNLQYTWQNRYGVRQAEVLHRLHENGRLFLLVSGAEDIRKLGALFSDKEACRITVGYQLSYPQQKLMVLTPEACKKTQQEGLYVVMIEQEEQKANEEYAEQGKRREQETQEEPATLSPGIPDEAFIRGKFQ